jgi:hypothetical protein
LKVLFDHNVPRSLGRFLVGHEVTIAADLGWATLENGDLLKAAESAGFDLLLTCDQNISYQQNLTGRRLAMVVLTTNYWPHLRNHAAAVAAAIGAAQSGSFLLVSLGGPPSRLEG